MTNVLIESLQRASIHGAIAITVVLIGCYIFRKSIDGVTECWLWRLVFVQMLALIFVASPFQIPILKSGENKTDAPEITARVNQEVDAEIYNSDSELTADFYDELLNAEAIVLARRTKRADEGKMAAPANKAASRQRSTTETSTIDWPFILTSIWAIGFVFCLLKLAFGWRKKMAIMNSLNFLDDQQSAKLVSVCDPALQSMVPELATTTLVGSPFLIGVMRPIIVLPESLHTELTTSQTREILSHEIAHLQRRDLCWDWLMTIVQAVFFFHPFVWIASGQCQLAKEIACDQRAVADSKTSMDSYADTLLMVSTSANSSLAAPVSTSMFRSRHHLKRRFHAMSAYTPNRRSAKLTYLLLICIAGLGIVPWQLTTQAATSASVESSETIATNAETIENQVPNFQPISAALPPIALVASVDEIDDKINELNKAFEDDPAGTTQEMRSFAIETARKYGTTSIEYGRVLGAAGRLYAKAGDHKTAIQLLTMAIDPRLASDEYQELQLDFKNELVDSLLINRTAAEAPELAAEALQKRKELFGEDKPGYAKGLAGMARLKMRQIKFSEAIELCNQAKTIYKKSATEFPDADHATLVLAECVNTIYGAAKKGTGSGKIKELLKSLDFTSTEDAIGWASLSKNAKKGLLNQLIYFQQLGDPATRMIVFEKLADKLKDEPGLSQQHISALIHQSNAADKLRLYPERLVILQATIRAAKPGDAVVCDLYAAMTRTYGSLEQPENIRKTFETAIGYAQQHDLKRNRAQLIQNYARWLVYSGQNDLAQPKYQQAVEAATEFGGILLGETQVGFGLFLHDQKEFAKAAEMFEASLENLPANSRLAMKAQMHLPFAKKGSPVPSASDSGVTIGEPIKMNMKEFQAFQKKLADEQKAKNKADGIKEEPEFVLYIKIPKALSAFDRSKIADPVDTALEAAELGEVFGGGTMISDKPFTGIDVTVKDLDKGLALIIETLKNSKVPEGTEILYSIDSKKESVDVWKE